MYAAERQHEILTRARAEGRVEVGLLAESLGVTVETVRRDLTALERLGAVRRVHGGALPVERLALEPNLASRESQHSEQKRRIAARALSELPDGGTMLLDSGTTTLAIAEQLPQDLEATIVTNSIAIATRLADHPRIDLLVLGGHVRHLTGAAVGDWIEGALKGLCVDIAFVGTNGFTVDRGLTTPDQAEAAAKRGMVLAGRRVVAVADASKVGHVHLHRFAEMDEVAMLITDDSLDDETADEIDAAGVEVIRA
ncbi:DeoR/GlpR family DNA-binding transcription regulator [Demequina capsici]|uniref:Lactose phosphotransferase system repressor n=1 Tax=Demequina capsici TaxID=3075620 RepID=A0AA96F6V2_9MICO|nr:DeoR/GlpR family DNA-binding transcription regulator [Demequina sp. OYTSA14]WNM25161.1 DeoR/GlpR family DNA-binding transcription regulator [Demequina sp. OYTSA14]